MRVRQVSEDDCVMLWEWANDPVVRASSFSTEPITWEEHVTWFTERLNDQNRYHYVALTDEGTPLGQVRFDFDGDEAGINVSIEKSFRGKGLGAEAIRLTSESLFRESSIGRIYAYVKPDNTPSLNAFTRAGYRMLAPKIIKGYETMLLVLDRSDVLTGGGLV